MAARSVGGYSPGGAPPAGAGVGGQAGYGGGAGAVDAATGDHKARWKPDENVPACERCAQQFTIIRRRHHCRRCGGVYCDACCASRARLPGFAEPQRVCQICRAIAPGAGLGPGDAGLAPGERDRKILFLEPDSSAGAASSGVVSSGGRLIDAVSAYGMSLATSGGSSGPGPATPSRGGGLAGSVYGAAGDEGAQNAAARRFTVTRGYVVYSLMLVDAAEHHATADMLPPLLTVGVSAFVLAFDVTERKWFDQLPLLRERILDCGGHSRTLALVGLVRTDATGVPKERAVPREKAEERAQQWDALYREIAVTSRDAVKDLIEALLSDISRRDGY